MKVVRRRKQNMNCERGRLSFFYAVCLLLDLTKNYEGKNPHSYEPCLFHFFFGGGWAREMGAICQIGAFGPKNGDFRPFRTTF